MPSNSICNLVFDLLVVYSCQYFSVLPAFVRTLQACCCKPGLLACCLLTAICEAPNPLFCICKWIRLNFGKFQWSVYFSIHIKVPQWLSTTTTIGWCLLARHLHPSMQMMDGGLIWYQLGGGPPALSTISQGEIIYFSIAWNDQAGVLGSKHHVTVALMSVSFLITIYSVSTNVLFRFLADNWQIKRQLKGSVVTKCCSSSPTMPIKRIHARQIFDSRGNPTIEVDVITELGCTI